MNLEGFSDGPENIWNEKQLAEIVKDYSNKWKTKFLITFDEKGVSEHPNHIACFKAADLLAKSEFGRNIRVYKIFIILNSYKV